LTMCSAAERSWPKPTGALAASSPASCSTVLRRRICLTDSDPFRVTHMRSMGLLMGSACGRSASSPKVWSGHRGQEGQLLQGIASLASGELQTPSPTMDLGYWLSHHVMDRQFTSQECLVEVWQLDNNKEIQWTPNTEENETVATIGIMDDACGREWSDACAIAAWMCVCCLVATTW
jgi:hypothetical protein